ncbi:DUF4142 domain-containing protein [Sphingomonas colocasiae]|uniref:DUF4142 domain-containing protein n=1 Tax=Sphingomonas colocasiae TaxID=1848973 RepID=A0ABS7PQM1_9SPHN|nr:DUF4142 domain-containing protein [Sphingomonas colocasiae]MBY8823486.1 DUF4142 domain-containing protein [Sphingomonas colocasiae]
MIRSPFALISVSVLALAACGPKDDATTANLQNVASAEIPGAQGAPALSPGQDFANKAAASDAFEIAISKLAADKAQSAAIKTFARKMIDAHTQSTAKLKTAAATATPPIIPDPVLTADQQAKLADLQSKSGAAFDAAFAAEQVSAHEAALDVLRGYAANGDVATLKTFATETTPIVTAHLNMAKSLKP